MTLTTDDALRIAAAGERPLFRQAGTFHVAAYGLEDENFVHVLTGAREWLVDGDDRFHYPDDQVVLVDRETGDLVRTDYLAVRDYLEEMTPFGDWPDD